MCLECALEVLWDAGTLWLWHNQFRPSPPLILSVSSLLAIFQFYFWCRFYSFYLLFLFALSRAVNIIVQLVECLLCIHEALGSIAQEHSRSFHPHQPLTLPQLMTI